MHVRASDAFFEFLWPISPPTSAFVGAWFGAMGVAFLFAVFLPGWPEARSLAAAAIIGAAALLMAPLVEEEFREDEFVLGWVWYIGLAAMFVTFPVLFLYQELLVDPDRESGDNAPVLARRLFFILGQVIWFFGLLTTITVGVLQPRWPWRCLFPGDCLGALPDRDMVAIGGVLLATAVAIWWGAVDGGRRAMQVSAVFGLFAGVLSLIAVLRFLEFVEDGWWSTIGLFALQGLLIASSLYVLVMTTPRPGATLSAEEPAAASI
jgi:hypothetical protein